MISAAALTEMLRSRVIRNSGSVAPRGCAPRSSSSWSTSRAGTDGANDVISHVARAISLLPLSSSTLRADQAIADLPRSVYVTRAREVRPRSTGCEVLARISGHGIPSSPAPAARAAETGLLDFRGPVDARMIFASAPAPQRARPSR